MKIKELSGKKDFIKKLKPFWKEWQKARREFLDKQMQIEKEMNKKLGLGIELEFFYCDGECCGIGAADYSEREKFPLIHDSELA